MSRFKSLKEAIFGAPKTPAEIKQSGNVVLGSTEQDYGVRLSTSFKDQVKVFNEDAVIKESVVQFAQEVISQGIFTSIDEAYGLVLAGKNAKQSIDEWNRLNDLDNNMLQISIELTAFGNSFWLITDNGFVNIPIQAIEQALPTNKTVPIADKYDLKLTGSWGGKTIPWGDFIHFRINITGYAPFGTGIILGILAEPDEDTPSLYEIRKSVRASMKEGFEKFSFGNEMWTFEGMADDKIEEVGKKITGMKSTGQRITTNVKGDIKLAVPQRTQSYDKWIEQIHFEFLMALANPSLKLGLEQGFTKATAEAAKEMFEMKIASQRRVIKRQIEGLWVKVLDKLGFEGLRTGIRLNFGSEDVQYVVADIFTAVEKGILGKEEARKILKKYAHWEISEDKPPEDAKPEPTKGDGVDGQGK